MIPSFPFTQDLPTESFLRLGILLHPLSSLSWLTTTPTLGLYLNGPCPEALDQARAALLYLTVPTSALLLSLLHMLYVSCLCSC